MELTVKELRDKLADYPDDYKIVIDRHYFDDGDYSYGWRNRILTDIEINNDDKCRQLELTVYE